MSLLSLLDRDDAVRRADTSTERGTFVTWSCDPHDTSLPHGNVLLIPGFTGSKEDFSALLPLLADAGWAGATYDQRGQFETAGGPADDYSLEGFADDAMAVADTLFGTSERVHLVGHSFGGLVAGVAAIAQPDRWASLTLMCSGPGAGSAEMTARLRRTAEIVEDEGLEAAWLAQQRDLESRGFAPEEPALEEFLRRRYLSSTAESVAAIARLVCTAPDRTCNLTALEIPVSVLRGEDDTWPHDHQDALADAVGTRVVVVRGAAHSPAVEQPELTRDALVRSWLR